MCGTGMHGSLDLRTIAPKGFQAYMPATIPQSRLDERAHVLGESPRTLPAGHPSATEALAPRENHETASPVPLTSFGPTTTRPLGDMALGRSGDKGANMNIGLFVSNAEEWGWLRSFLTCAKMKELMGEDWSDTYFLERVEFPNIWAVHFVVYGSLGRGVSSSSRLDCLGKGFADFIRARTVDVPVRFVS